MNPFNPLVDAIVAAVPELAPGDIGLGAPPNLALGDVAVRLFDGARRLHCAPAQLAQRIIDSADFGGLVRESVIAGPYLNLKLDRPAFAREIVGGILDAGAHYGSGGTGRGVHALIEHTSINPNASPHVGRARNAMIGDSLARLLRFEGYAVTVHYYVNDMGRQIGLLVLVAGDADGLSFEQMLEKYVEANRRAKEDPAFAAQGYGLLAKMEEGDVATAAQFHRVTELCLRGQVAVLERIGACYDVFDRESRFIKDPRLDAVIAALQSREAVFTDEEGRLVVDLSRLGHTYEEGRYFVLMRANGSSMYGYRDLAYNIEKATRGADVDLVVLGEDHKLYQQQITMILEAAGHKAPEPIYYSYILLKDGKMSTRQGKVVLLSDFLDQAQALSAERVAEQCKELAEDAQQAIAASVAVAAIRFAVLKVSPNKNVTFDMEANLSFTGDTGPYIQYSCARISSILRKHGAPVPTEPAQAFPAKSDAEWRLAMKLAEFGGVVSGCVAQRNCAPVAQYALECARAFTAFYHDCPVLAAETAALRDARLQLCAATRQTIANALGILGIEAPEQM